MKAANILETIGGTPHIRLSRLFPDHEVWIKSERSNPGGSIKDRIALAMVEDAEASGALKPGGKVFVRVPNFGSLNRRVIGKAWCGFRHPDHVNYFTTDTLERLAGQLGFRVQILNKGTLWVDDNIKAVLHRT